MFIVGGICDEGRYQRRGEREARGTREKRERVPGPRGEGIGGTRARKKGRGYQGKRRGGTRAKGRGEPNDERMGR